MQIKAPKGGGSIPLNLAVDATYEECMMKAKGTFYPDGISNKGKWTSMTSFLANFRGMREDNMTKLLDKGRMYLFTKKRVSHLHRGIL